MCLSVYVLGGLPVCYVVCAQLSYDRIASVHACVHLLRMVVYVARMGGSVVCACGYPSPYACPMVSTLMYVRLPYDVIGGARAFVRAFALDVLCV